MIAWLGVLLLALVLAPRPAGAQEDFYRGKTLRVIVGFSAGGGYDTYTRALARHMSRHIPGNPAILVENMTGAGSLIAANYVYKAAKPDGLTLGHFSGGLLLGQVLGQKGVEFDAKKFEYVGAWAREHVVCGIHARTGVANLEQWKASRTPLKLGGVAPGSATPDNATRLLKAATGLPIQLVTGYKGTADIRLAVDSGELGGSCWGWNSVRVTWRKALDAGEVRVVLQMAPKAHPDLPAVPLASSLVTTDEGRAFLDVIYSEAALTRAYTLPPGTPKDRVAVLRKAFADTLRDPAFLAEADKAKLEIDLVSGEELERALDGYFRHPPALTAKLKQVLLE
jgi:tripartite-type tricarboxylate transporter receptor subunit TctC